MANKSLFQSLVGKVMPRADAVNEAGGLAYQFTPKQALAQFAATGCFNSTYYVSAEDQLATVLALCEHVEPEFIARTALYARQHAHMKDLPAFLCAILSVKSPGLLAEVFDRVIDNGKMLRNFVQVMRSGVVGRKSLGTLPKRLVVQWLEQRTDEQLFRASVGNDPSLADVVRMVHPKPATESRKALYAYLIGREYDAAKLTPLVVEYEAFKGTHADSAPIPDVPMEMLTALPLSTEQWKAIARKASWQSTRMNLNTFARHGVLEGNMVQTIADKLKDPAQVVKARVLPYQLLMAYKMTSNVPTEVREALQDAMEVAVQNVPQLGGKVWVFPDVSGSMHSPVTGHRKGSTTAVRCVDVAALVTAAVLRRNPGAGVIPFTEAVVQATINPRDSIMTNATKMASLPPGGTNCSAPLALLNTRKDKGDLLIYVSDNQSWVDTAAPRLANPGVTLPPPTETLRQWAIFKARNPGARMVCIDLQPATTTQAQERADIMNIGGFSDAVFTLMAQFAKGELSPDHWVSVIEQVSL
jgi:60 kDa SS-A/Ro ribonucleoprotein